jgi:adiponectin receptor
MMTKSSLNASESEPKQSYEELQEEAYTSAPPHPFIGLKEEAPEWLTTGYYLETGWRVNFNSWGKAFRSLFMIHNETVNVWSHLLGALFFLAMLIYVPIKLDTADYFDTDSSMLISTKG